jgi:DNA-binding GntR family transcriptional regulator
VTDNTFSSVLSPSSRTSLAEDIVITLRQAIATGKLAPGERLQEQLLAESLGVSRGPVREALVMLEREGLIIKQRNRGAVVARLSEQDLDEVFSLRMVLERLAVQRLVRFGTEAELDELQGIVDHMNMLARRGITPQEAAEYDLRYHEVIFRASRHQRLLDAWMNLRPQIHVFLLSRNVAHIDFRHMVVPGHQELLDAMRRRDETAAVSIVEDHMGQAYQRIVQGLGVEAREGTP